MRPDMIMKCLGFCISECFRGQGSEVRPWWPWLHLIFSDISSLFMGARQSDFLKPFRMTKTIMCFFIFSREAASTSSLHILSRDTSILQPFPSQYPHGSLGQSSFVVHWRSIIPVVMVLSAAFSRILAAASRTPQTSGQNLMFTPKIGEANHPFWRAYLSNGLVETTN